MRFSFFGGTSFGQPANADSNDLSARTKAGAESTAMIGASLGGLFSFYAAWTRGDVFSRAACLSPS